MGQTRHHVDARQHDVHYSHYSTSPVRRSAATAYHTPTTRAQDWLRRQYKTPSVTSSSRPPTPAVSTRPATPPEVKTLRPKEQAPLPPTSPSPSVAVDSDDIGSGSQDVSPSPGRPRSAESMDSIPAAPVSVPLALPDAPPGLPPPTRTPKADPAAAPGLQAPQISS